MREPPANLADATLRAGLRDRYGLAVSDLAFLPRGHDASAWVYRAVADGRDYFLKVRARVANEAGLLVPRLLLRRGIARVVAPLPTVDGALWAEAGGFALLLYPYIAGPSGMDRGLSSRQWRAYGALLRRIHDTALDADLAAIMRRDTFRPAGRDLIAAIEARLDAGVPADPAARSLAALWRERRGTIRALIERADALGRRLAHAAPPPVLCHADIHTGNLLLDDDGEVWIVDWDETILAPRERDLMFAIGGISRTLVGPREEALFRQGYGAVAVDPPALAYYRHAWAVADIAAFGEEILFRPDLGPATRGAAAEFLAGLFAPGEIVSIALASDAGARS